MSHENLNFIVDVHKDVPSKATYHSISIESHWAFHIHLGPTLISQNPLGPSQEITWFSEETSWMWEGCLSVPGLRGWVERPREIRMKGLNEHGESHGFCSKTVGIDGDTMKIGRKYI